MSRPRMRSDFPRVVLDTNIVVSTLVFSGSIARLRAAWQSGACLPLVSADTVHELVRVLAYPKFRLDEREREDLLADYLPYAEVVRIPAPVRITPACRDPFDLPFLKLAIAGKADALISGDRDLLAVSGRIAFETVMPEAFTSSMRA